VAEVTGKMAAKVTGKVAGDRSKLRRELGFLGLLALAVGIMGPTGALSITGVPTAGLVGQAVPLAFLFASVAVLPVAYGFIRLSQHISHAGSLYAYCGITLGPRVGFLCGWSLAAVYIAFTAGAAALLGLFGSAFLQYQGISFPWYWIGIVASFIIAALTYLDVKVVTRILIAAEGVSLSLVAILFVVIYYKIATGAAPQHQVATLAPFSLPTGLGVSIIGLASVGGFLSFAGFEGTATMGEESKRAMRTIPKVLLVLVLGLAVYFTFGVYTEVIGFGTDTHGINAFANSSSALADLAALYVGKGLASLIDAGAMLSICGACLGTAVAASRIIFALARDGFGPRVLGRTSRRFGAPYGAITLVMAITLIAVVVFAATGTSGVNAFFYPGTFGTLLLLVLYATTEVGAINYLFVRRRVSVPSWEIVIPAVGILILVYVLYRNVWPIPSSPFNYILYLTGAWLLVGVGAVLVAPRLASSIGSNFMRDSGGVASDESGA
jgi:amino acid transporter